MGRKVREVREIANYLREVHGKMRRATARALVRTATAASNQAKKNARNNFKGSRERPKQGFLVHAIFAGFTIATSKAGKYIAEAMVGVKSRKGNAGTKPYGRIHEYGGPIVPVKAKYLWIPLVGPKSSGERGRFKNLTPRDLVGRLKQQERSGKRKGFSYSQKKKGKLFGSKRKFEGEFKISPDQSGNLTAWFVRNIGKGKGLRHKFYALYALRKRVDIPARPYVRPAVELEYAKFQERLDSELSRGKNKRGDKTPPNQG